MVKWMLTIGCAAALLAIAQGAKAYELDEDGNPVFYDDEELNEYLLWLAGQDATDEAGGGGGLEDSCTFETPEAYAVTTRHYVSGAWHSHVITAVYWDSEQSEYYVCLDDNGHALSDVDALKCNWRHDNGTGICDWCDYDYEDYWLTQYRQVGIGWANNTEDWGCTHAYPSGDSVYWGEEEDWFSDFDYSSGNAMCRFKGVDPEGYISKVNVHSCPE